MAITIGAIVEDIRFAKFIVPAMRKLAECQDLDMIPVEKIRGCRPAKLVREFGLLSDRCDLVIVGADAKAKGRRVTHKKKARSLESLLERDPMVLPAVADPSVEAWLYCDPRSFAQGISVGTHSEFHAPDHWPKPRSEREAKEQLGRLIHEGCGNALPDVFDFAPEIVERMDLVRAPNGSLAEWARAFVARIDRAVLERDRQDG